jgi:hypothetical protein
MLYLMGETPVKLRNISSECAAFLDTHEPIGTQILTNTLAARAVWVLLWDRLSQAKHYWGDKTRPNDARSPPSPNPTPLTQRGIRNCLCLDIERRLQEGRCLNKERTARGSLQHSLRAQHIHDTAHSSEPEQLSLGLSLAREASIHS